MKIKLAIPENLPIKPQKEALERFTNENNITIFQLQEKQCIELYLSGKVDACLVNPLDYGKNLDKSDSVIVPYSAISIIDYTEVASLIFEKELDTFQTIATSNASSFLFIATKLILAERYDMVLKETIFDGSEKDMLAKADCAFILGKSKNDFNSLDIGEEWYDTFEMPLPFTFWICRTEEHPDDIEKIILAFSEIVESKSLGINENKTKHNDIPERHGRIEIGFNPEFEEALAQTFHFLYYHQQIKDIPELKILGRENDESNS